MHNARLKRKRKKKGKREPAEVAADARAKNNTKETLFATHNDQETPENRSANARESELVGSLFLSFFFLLRGGSRSKFIIREGGVVAFFSKRLDLDFLMPQSRSTSIDCAPKVVLTERAREREKEILLLLFLFFSDPLHS